MRTKTTAAALLLTAFSLLAFSTVVRAQSIHWTALKATPKGIDVIVERKNDDRVIGVLQAVTDDSIAVTSDEGSFIIGKDNITKVFHGIPRNKKKLMNRGALYGMLIGLGAGVALTSAFPPENEEMPFAGTFLAGGAIGAWAGVRRAKGKDRGPLIYSAR